MVLVIQVRLKSTSPFSILKINTVCQILLDKASQALKIQKHKCPGIDIGPCVGLWVFKCEFLFVQEAKGKALGQELDLWMNLGQLFCPSETQFCHQ